MNQRKSSGSGLIIILVLASIAIGVIGWVLPISKTFSGSASCVTTVNSCTTSTITFPTPYANIPLVEPEITTFSPGPVSTLTFTTKSTQNIIFSNPTGNSSILLYDSETPVTITVPNVDTPIKSFAPSYPVPSPGFLGLLVESTGYITVTAAIALAQDISIFIADSNAGTILQTIKVHVASVTVNEKIPFHIKTIDTAPIFFGFTESIDAQAPATDVNTQVTAVNLRVEGLEQNFQTWLNPPANPTPLFGTNDIQLVNVPVGVNGNEQVLVCVNVIFGGNTPMNVTLQESTSQTGPWSAIASDFLGTPLSCQDGYTVNLPTGFIYLRVVMEKGTGANDILMVGKIDASIIYPFLSSVNQNVSFFVQAVSITQSSFAIKITFTQNLATPVTTTFNWQSR